MTEVEKVNVDWDSIRLAFTDMDGTIYKGTNDFPTTPEFIQRLRDHVDHVYFLTNNSSKSHTDYHTRLTGLGIKVDKQDILLSTDGLRAFLVKEGIHRVHLIGTRALESCLAEHGIMSDSEDPEAIVLGFDTELTYAKLKTACLLMQHTDIPYYSTHIDDVCPTESGDIPDAGAMMALIEKATGRRPDTIFGKPSRSMVSHICEQHGVTPEQAIFFGDRIYTDYQMAFNCGAVFVGVLTGEATRDDYADCTNTVVVEKAIDIFD